MYTVDRDKFVKCGHGEKSEFFSDSFFLIAQTKRPNALIATGGKTELILIDRFATNRPLNQS